MAQRLWEVTQKQWHIYFDGSCEHFLYVVRLTGPPSTKRQNFVTMLFFSIKVPTTKHEIMLHEMSLKTVRHNVDF